MPDATSWLMSGRPGDSSGFQVNFKAKILEFYFKFQMEQNEKGIKMRSQEGKEQRLPFS